MKSRPKAPLAVLLVLSLLAGSLPLPPAGGAASPRPLWTFATPGDLRGSPSVADLDGDGALETVVSADSLGLVVLDTNGTMKWTFSLPSTVVTTPLLADIDSDGKTELVAGTDGGMVYTLSPDRSLLWTYEADGAIATDATAADLDGDGKSEVLFGNDRGTVMAVGADGRERWRFSAGGALRACLVAADLTGDGLPEVVVASGAGRLYLLGPSGSPVWNASTGSPLLADPAVFDLDLDGRPEVLTGAANGNVTAWKADGTPFWTYRAGGSVNSSIAIADSSGGRPEVLFGCDDGRLYCLSPAGALERTYYCGSPVGQPAPFAVGYSLQVAFPARDGKIRILGANCDPVMSWNVSAVPGSSCAVACLRAYDLPAVIINGEDGVVRCLPMADIPTLEWRTRQHDARRTGALPASPGGALPGSLEWRTPLQGSPDGPPSAADTDGDGRAEVAVATANGTLYLLNGSSGAVRWRVDAPGPAMRPSAPLVRDLNGDSAPDVAWAGPDGVLRALSSSNGAGLWRQDLGIYEASPAAGDLDADGLVEVAIGTDSGAFVCVDGRSGAPERTVNLTDGVRATAALVDPGGGPALGAMVSTAGSVLVVRNGTVLWTTADPVFLPTAPLIGDLNVDGTPDVIVGTGWGELRAFSGIDGRSLWNLSLGAAVTEPPVQAILSGANVYGIVVSVSDGSLVGVSGRYGEILWKVQAGARTSPSVADPDLDYDHEIMVGTRAGLDAFTSSGAHLWHYPVPGGVLSSPAIADTDLDGTLDVVFGGRDGYLYSLSAGGCCSPGDAPWPQYRHDAHRTGTSLVVSDRLLPDLEVVPRSFQPSVAFPDEGEAITVKVYVGNAGVAPSPECRISLTDNGTPVGTSQEFWAMEAGRFTRFDFPWNPQGGDHVLEVIVDSGGTVPELREDNNAARRTIRVNFLPVAVPGNDLRVDLGAVVLFDGSASRDPDGEISEYLWSFGDGGTSHGISPTHRYTAFGRFTVTLEVTDDSGASASGSLNVTVNGPPRILDRSPATDVTMAENETQSFTVTATDPESDPFSVLWRLDGAEAGAGERFAYCPDYSSEGNHTLAAEVSDGTRTVSTGWNITVRDSPSPILAHWPVWRNLSASTGDLIGFGIELAEGPAAIQWYLDGQPVDGASGPVFELLAGRSSVGSHTISVVVNASGHRDGRDWSLEVLRHNAPPSFDRIEPPGDSALMLSHGTQEFLVVVGDPDGGALSIQWYLDGAALLNETGARFVYQDRGGRGRVNVTAVASDGELSAAHTWTVRVNVPPTALFSASKKTAPVKSTVAFDGSPSFDPDGNITGYGWSFGDGSSLPSGGANASHSYARPGVYTVQLWVTDELGATSNATMTIAVGQPAEGVRSSGSWGLLALGAVAVLAALGGARHRRKKGFHQRD